MSRRFELCIALLLLLLLLLAGCQQADPPVLIIEPPTLAAYDTAQALQETDPPERDLVALAARLQGVTVGDSAEQTFQIGDSDRFFYVDEDNNSNVETTATLRYQSDILNMWIEDTANVSERAVNEAAEVLESQIIPQTRAAFGVERQPGLDGDARVTILHLDDAGGTVAGYFSAADAFPQAANPFSNEREMLYISFAHAPLGSEMYYKVIAHEMQHMVHWSTDSNETTWLDEGLAELSAHISGYTDEPFISGFAATPDTPLTNFSYEEGQFPQQYGASFLFAAYLLDRFGRDTVRAIVEHPANGTNGINAVLATVEKPTTFDEVFADWVVANYLAGRELGRDPYRYTSVTVPSIDVAAQHRRLPVSNAATVNQFGVDYVEIATDMAVTLTFTGSQQTRLLDADPVNGAYYVSTVPADDSDLTLTRAFDLSTVPTATLVFQNWYEIETGWDYGYVLASADNGVSWDFLETIYTTTANPYGNLYGPGLTGESGRGGDSAEWAEQRADLTPYAGGPVLIRFEYITDDAVYEDGWALDEIAIPEIGYVEDFETDLGDWDADGFVRHTNRLPQTYVVQAIRISDDGNVIVERLPLDATQRGQFVLPMGDGTEELVLAISGSAPVTAVPAAYQYEIEPSNQ
ncbi:MAG: immune inhibitor A [Anaerolineae bacterium]|nr:immune inhibitor A [Anaerolineae bacterium]